MLTKVGSYSGGDYYTSCFLFGRVDLCAFVRRMGERSGTEVWGLKARPARSRCCEPAGKACCPGGPRFPGALGKSEGFSRWTDEDKASNGGGREIARCPICVITLCWGVNVVASCREERRIKKVPIVTRDQSQQRRLRNCGIVNLLLIIFVMLGGDLYDQGESGGDGDGDLGKGEVGLG